MERRELFGESMTSKLEDSVRSFVEIYVETVLDLAKENYHSCEFYHRLEGRVSSETGLSLDATKYIGQVLSNFGPFKVGSFSQNGNAKSQWLGIQHPTNLWGSSFIVLGSAPSEEEKIKEVQAFLGFYGRELLNRVRSVYWDEEKSRTFFD